MCIVYRPYTFSWQARELNNASRLNEQDFLHVCNFMYFLASHNWEAVQVECPLPCSYVLGMVNVISSAKAMHVLAGMTVCL